LDQKIAEDQDIHAGAEEAVDGLFRGQNNGLVFVEGGILKHRHAVQLFEFLDQREKKVSGT
jgi:hypothetical protein